jgi:hypothetical protein
MDINIFCLKQYAHDRYDFDCEFKNNGYYKEPIPIEIIAYSHEEVKKLMNETLKKYNIPLNSVPYEETFTSDTYKKFISSTNKLLGGDDAVYKLDAIALKSNCISNKVLSEDLINYCWRRFVIDVCSIKRNSNKLGREEYFEQTLNNYRLDSKVSEDNIISERLSMFNYENSRFIKTYLVDLPEIYKNFQSDKKMPVFLNTTFDAETGKYKIITKSSFGEVLINSKYFLNSPIDVIIGDTYLEHNSIGDKNIPTIESICDFIIKKMDISSDDCIIDIFLVRNDADSWTDGITKLKDKSYTISGVEISKKKDNYYEDAMNKLYIWKKIYDFIVDSELNSDEDFKLLFDKIVFI